MVKTKDETLSRQTFLSLIGTHHLCKRSVVLRLLLALWFDILGTVDRENPILGSTVMAYKNFVGYLDRLPQELDVILALNDALTEMNKLFHSEMMQSFERFKASHANVGGFLSPLKRLWERTRWIHNPSDVRALYQCVAFVDRVPFNGVAKLEDDKRYGAAVEHWLSVDQSIKNWDQHDDDVCRCFKNSFGNFKLSEWDPWHSAGAVSDAKTSIDDKELSVVLPALHRHVDLMNSRLLEKPSITSCYPWLLPEDEKFKDLLYSAQVMVVPKNARKFRTITMIPVVHQMYAQAYMRNFLRYFSKYHHDFLDLRDQTRNRELSRLGSIDGSYTTIDASDASDTIGFNELRSMCSCNTQLTAALLTQRCCVARIDGKLVWMNKFAGMGSSVTFPFLSMLIHSCASAAVHDVAGRHPVTGDFSVYGDDCVIRSEFASRCIYHMKMSFFNINQSKTFTAADPYKESCGGEFYNGYDVVPCRLSRFFRRRPEPCWQSSYVSLANEAYKRKLKTLRCLLIDELFRQRRDLCPMFTDNINDDTRLYSPQPTNFRGLRREDSSLQRERIIHGTSVRSKFGSTSEEICLTASLRKRHDATNTFSLKDNVAYLDTPTETWTGSMAPQRWSTTVD